MMKMIYIFIFLICYFNYSKSPNVYTIEQIFKILENLTESENNLKMIIDSLSKTLNKVYAYNEIAKIPPQPSFDNNYYNKINIQEMLNKINTKNTNIYNFYRDIKLVLDSLGDHHLTFGGELILNYLNFLEPLRLSIKEYENKNRIFAQPIIYTDFFKYFRNNETIFDIIKKNIDIPIKSINGKDPFDYITNFGGVFKKLKSPQATFRYKFINHNSQTLNDYPLSIEELTNFTVIYDNGDIINTDFIIYSTKSLDETEFIKENKFFVLNNNKKISNLFINKDINNNSNILKDEKNNFNKNNRKINNILGSIDWDYDSDLSIYCKADNSKKVNIYLVNNFNINEGPRYLRTVKNCIELFDKNDYPIIFINVFNKGGLIYNAQLLLELLSPKIALNIYGAFKSNDVFKDNEIFNNEILSQFSDSETCEIFDYKNFIKKTKKIKYDSQVTDTLSGPIIFNGKKFRKEINSMKKNLKNPRNPTDIIVYTDGYSFSAGAIMIKFLQYYGGAITAGYFPNPNLNNIPYDSGSSASSLFTYKILQSFDIEEYKILENFNYYLSVPAIQIFYNQNDLSHPLEYEVTPVDEIVNIYPKLENLFNLLDENGYDSFIDISLKIFEKYKTHCNPNNKKLLLLTDNCDGKFENNYTHGGYMCGDDGIWTKICVPSYCDIGYIFDHISNKCVIDICSEKVLKSESRLRFDSKLESVYKSESKSETEYIFKNKNYILLNLIFASVFISIIIALAIIIYKLIKRKNLKKELNLLDEIKLDERMNSN